MGAVDAVEIGERFRGTRWVVLGGPEKRSGVAMWWCRCDCGTETWVRSGNLIYGFTNGCRKCSKHQCLLAKSEESFVGKTIEGCLVLQCLGSNSHGHKIYLCQCECGQTFEQRARLLRIGKPSVCVGCKRRRKLSGVWKKIWLNLNYNAVRRGIQVAVSKEHCIKLLESQNFKCALSGIPISIAETIEAHYRGESSASLDRIDSTLGYVPENLQWVHKDVNKMKREFSQDRYIEICKLVASNSLS